MRQVAGAALLCALQAPPARTGAAVSLGAPEVVFHGGTSPGSCDDYDLPDAPARAWRDGMGRWARFKYLLVGPTLPYR